LFVTGAATVLGAATVGSLVVTGATNFAGGITVASLLVTGAVTSATGVFVFPVVPYLQSLKFDKDELVQALGLSFTVSTLALFARLLLEGSFAPAHLPGMAMLLAPLPASLLGMALGQKLRSRLDEKKFRRVFFAGLLSIGIYMLARGLLH
ncbi:MAG: TSUP family transporter, partial [Pseudomonadota bacterium]